MSIEDEKLVDEINLKKQKLNDLAEKIADLNLK